MDYSKYKKLNEGKEANVYIKDKNTLIKIYKDPTLYDDIKIKKLMAKQNKIQHSKMPINPIYENKKVIGCELKYHNHHKPFHSLRWEKDKLVKIEMLEILKNNLKELTDNYIYHLDIDEYNILIDKKNREVEMIDLDGIDTLVKDKEDINAMKTLLMQYRTLMLELLYKEYDYMNFYFNPIKTLKKCGIEDKNINILIDKNFSYNNISLFLKNVKKEKIKNI